MNFRTCLIILFGLLFLPTYSEAERPLVPLKNGMSYQDVLVAWGPPLEKIELEIKRVDKWIYPRGQVVFRQGKLKSWEDSRANLKDPWEHGKKDIYLESSGKLTEKSSDKTNTQDKVQSTKDIISEILEELPSEDGPPSGPHPVTGGPQRPSPGMHRGAR